MTKAAVVEKESVQKDSTKLSLISANSGKDKRPATVKRETQSEIKTDEDLVERIFKLEQEGNSSLIRNRHGIGTNIISHYKGKYGDSEMERLAEKTGIAKDTLYKSCQFARQYTQEQLDQLLGGEWPMSWRMISLNLDLETETLIKTYLDADSKSAFYDAVRKLKGPKTRAKKVQPKRPKCDIRKHEYVYLVRNQVDLLKQQVNEKDAEIKRLKDQLAELQKESAPAADDEEGFRDIITD